MTDKASFDKEILKTIWMRTGCVITCQSQFDVHHILGRGHLFGAPKKNSEKRVYFSSPYNAIPIHNLIHSGPMRDSVEMRFLFLRLAKQKVEDSIRLGKYTKTIEDEEFIKIADEWKENNKGKI